MEQCSVCPMLCSAQRPQNCSQNHEPIVLISRATERNALDGYPTSDGSSENKATQLRRQTARGLFFIGYKIQSERHSSPPRLFPSSSQSRIL